MHLIQTQLEGLSPWGLLLHCEENLADWEKYSALGKDILPRMMGVSVYNPEAANSALAHADLNLLQVPGNVFDRRFLNAEFLQMASSAGVTVMVRSIFLQGLAFMSPTSVSHIPHAPMAIQSLDAFCHKHKIDKKHFCVQFVRDKLAGIGGIILFGAENPKQVEEIAGFFSTPLHPVLFDEWETIWPTAFEELINPTFWKCK
jgi:aryl-alcohol dehydrogenase-like predicted oxidoreductase